MVKSNFKGIFNSAKRVYLSGHARVSYNQKDEDWTHQVAIRTQATVADGERNLSIGLREAARDLESA